MYRVLEIESQQEPPAKPITMTHHDACLMRISSVRLGTLGGRVTVEESISCYYTVFRYGCYGAGLKREVSQDARWRSACTKLVRGARASVIRLRVSIANLLEVVSYGMIRRREKKEVLMRVLLIRWIVAESLQSTCPDVCRREHHWRYRRKTRRHRLQ